MTEKSMQKVNVAINDLPALKIAEDSRVHNKFVSLFNTIHGRAGEQMYDVEKFHFTKQLMEKPDLQNCSKMSLYGAFLDVAVQGLSFDPNKKLCYLTSDNVNVGTKDSPRYEKRCRLTISPYGELYLRQLYGQITSAENPEVVYEGEDFTITTDRNGRSVQHTIKFPRPTGKIIAVYFRFIKADGTSDFGILDLNDMARLKGYSERKNKGKANALYGTDGNPDKGFFMAKCIKHAFRAYPKVKLKGQFSQIEADPETDDAIDYTIQDETEVQVNTATPETAQMTMKADEETGEVVMVQDQDNF